MTLHGFIKFGAHSISIKISNIKGKILQNASIIAIEADPDRYKELNKNCAKWEKESSNTITAINTILGEYKGLTTFYKTGTNISGGLFPVGERSDAYRPIKVPQTILDEYYEARKQILVKIDVEGAEYRVMQGATKHLSIVFVYTSCRSVTFPSPG